MAASPDVVVVGGGIAGCAAAYFLAREGAKVTLFEKDSVASHASGFAFGGILTKFGIEEGHPLYGLMHAADRLHAELGETLAGESGVDPEYRRKAAVFLAMSQPEAESYRQTYRQYARGFSSSEFPRPPELVSGPGSGSGVRHSPTETSSSSGQRRALDIRWLGRGELSHIEARIAPQVIGGLYAGDSLEVEPYKLTLGLWQAAERRGARLVNRAVTGVIKSGGHVTGVQAGGEKLSAGAVVIAAGPWSAEAGKWLGMHIPVEPLKGQVLRLEAPEPPMEVSLWWAGDYAASKPDGLVWVGTTEEHAGFDETPTAAAREKITASAVRALPYLRDAKLVKQTACLRPLTPDRLPIVGTVPGLDGAVVATGAGRNGIELGPAMGLAAAELALGRKPSFDIGRLALDRFYLPPGPSM